MEIVLFLIIIALLFVANLAERDRIWLWLVALFIVGSAALAGLAGLVFALLGAGLLPVEALADAGPLVGGPWATLFALILMAGAVLMILLLVPAVRRLLVRLLRFRVDADRPIIVTALFLSVGLLGLTATSLITSPSLPVETFEQLSVTQRDLWVQGLLFAAAGFVGVGFLVRRGWQETLERLGLTRITPRMALWALGLVIVLLLFSTGIDMAWARLDPTSYERTSSITEAMLGNLSGPLAALTIGLSAGIGEEILFRGAIQPRFGLIGATLLFTIGHTQYEVTPALLIVFLIGLVLGIVRKRFNTSTAILIHALYNASLLLIPWLLELLGL
ncbi:MAG: CPBP family intramembrane metalloprotease [Anaerolineales bacterium]|nr:CPBP family intramembrane metalloprotease [Anaerolineales bacterium]MCB9128861.1 CPBP family intramembrane metalloprotease [Ardenticatenales bacterium]MCB9171427.1 CPBP family intramembrane metalloprotease [Ardenticatenales bacterium]